MSNAEPPPSRHRDLSWFAVGLLLPVPFVIAYSWGGLGLTAEGVVVLGGVAILGAAFMLSWSCELAERDIPQALALLVLALVGVLPEYAIDLHFAWVAGKDPSYAGYAIANMTGANRLLIGLGWAVVVLVACARSRTKELVVDPSQRLELQYLIWATLYSFVIPLSGTINLLDGVILLSLFAAYVRSAMAGEETETDLVGPAELIDSEFEDMGRRIWAALLFAFAGFAIFIAAEPFAESLVVVGRSYDIDEFLLVQWLAPVASESPEFVVATIFAWKLRGSLGIGALISSKVNQWTLLVGAIPVAYAISLGGWSGLPLDSRQTSELLLTSAQSLFAALLIANLRFSRVEAIMLAALFMVQLCLPNPTVRWAFVFIYLGLSLGVLIRATPAERSDLFRMVFSRPGGFGSRSASSSGD